MPNLTMVPLGNARKVAYLLWVWYCVLSDFEAFGGEPCNHGARNCCLLMMDDKGLSRLTPRLTADNHWQVAAWSSQPCATFP
jgi:hypothetical protein